MVFKLNSFLPTALIVGLSLTLVDRTAAQTLTNLHHFNGADGENPMAGLILSENTLYGTTWYGGPSGRGTVFAVRTDGSGFTNLHCFSAGGYNGTPAYTNSDGARPFTALLLSGGVLYGTTESGGSAGLGTLFKLNTDGSGFTNLYVFTAANSEGARPDAALVLSGNTLYGTALRGGSSDGGTIFAVNTDGSGFRTLHQFTGGSDGDSPYAGLTLSGDTLFGTASGGGSGSGTIFAIKTDGTSFTNLYSFTPRESAVPGVPPYTNSDGAYPQCVLVLSGDTFYGTTPDGGTAGRGTVFAVSPDGTGFRNLHNFSGSDGCWPEAGLVLVGNTLYGTTEDGGSSGYGVVFAVKTDGTGFTNLHHFTGASGADGSVPYANLIASGDTLYGTAMYGGHFDQGTIFSLSLASASAPQLAIFSAGTSVVLTWPTNAVGYTLQSNTNLLAAGDWTPVVAAPAIVNELNTVTNAVSGRQRFFRLSR
jgi:uncharacterized repeat protein (TIGR03803 family)